MKYLALLFSVIAVISCSQPSSVHTLQGNALGTTYSLKYFSDSQITSSEIDSILSIINSSMSTYVDSSDISKLNAGDSTVVVDEHFQYVFEASKRIYKATDGYFDPSVGLLVNAYGFGPEGYTSNVTPEQIDSLYHFIGFDKVKLNHDSTISFESASYIDFNAIAKGYTVDVIADFLASRGAENYLVEIGGEVIVNGKNLNSDSPWKIGIETPVEAGSRELKYAIPLRDQALATSGNYRKFRVDSTSGQKFVHTINPKTGKSQKTDILSATVVAETCIDADAFATAFMAMGLHRSKAYLDSNKDISAILIYSDEAGNQKTFISDALKATLEEF